MYVIYRATNIINQKVYFGKTCNLKYRWYQHQRDAKYGSQLPFHRAIRKYGAEGFRIEVLASFEVEGDADLHEQSLIAMAAPGASYNVAKGGEGGHTMSPEQLNAQYSVKPSEYEEFRGLFQAGVPALTIAAHFKVAYRAVQSCAKRLGLSFKERRKKGSRPRKPRIYKPQSNPTMTPEQRSEFRAEVARKSNKARGLSEQLQLDALRLYFESDYTCQEVAEYLGVSSGAIRGVVNRTYKVLSEEERALRKARHGSQVRSGKRNANYRGKK